MKKIFFLLFFGLIMLGYGSDWGQSFWQAPTPYPPPSNEEAANHVPDGRLSDQAESVAAQRTQHTLTIPEAALTVEETDMSETQQTPAQSKPVTPTDQLTLFSFDGEGPPWFTVNDDVMGGVSQSVVTIDSDVQRLIFSGTLSLENNGGFASTRSQWTEYDLGDYDGIKLRVRGDGKIAQLRIRAQEPEADIAYMATFPTVANEWQDVTIAFADMVPTYRGFVVSQAGPLNPALIRSFGLMLSDKQQGEFLLEVDSIHAVTIP